MDDRLTYWELLAAAGLVRKAEFATLKIGDKLIMVTDDDREITVVVTEINEDSYTVHPVTMRDGPEYRYYRS